MRVDSKVYTNIEQCRLCRSRRVKDVLYLGEQFLASFVQSNQATPLAEIKVPLTVVMCQQCGTVQLKEDVRREVLFHDYFYRSATNPMMRTALHDLVDDVMRRIELRAGDVVLDIGCNDATMLVMFPDACRRIGVDPAANLNWDHVRGQVCLLNEFFEKQSVMQATGGERCRVITTVAMLYNMKNLDGVVRDIASLLAPDGLWCIQLSYLPALLETLSFYDVCHEHLYYFSLQTLQGLLERYGLSVVDASTNQVNGGSLRVFVRHQSSSAAPSDAVAALLAWEAALKLDDPRTYQSFYQRLLELRSRVVGYLEARRSSGQVVVGLGASTKGNVLLQFFGIDKQLLPCISERNPDKVGMRTLGTDIEVVSEQAARDMRPSSMLVLIWFFKEELLRRERAYLEAGGQLLFPMPYPHLVTVDGEQRLP